ncbi:MAG: hypothetical protein WAW88_02705 [Nocardioides sp.]
MIRLGSLAGYPFEGPRLLAGWTPPATAGVFVVLYRPDEVERASNYAVIYAGEAEDLSTIGLPLRHPAARCWVKRAGSKWKLHVATYEVPGGTATHRAMIVSELVSVYRPGCNDQQFDPAWKEEWIGSHDGGTTGNLTTSRDPRRKPTAD